MNARVLKAILKAMDNSALRYKATTIDGNWTVVDRSGFWVIEPDGDCTEIEAKVCAGLWSIDNDLDFETVYEFVKLLEQSQVQS